MDTLQNALYDLRSSSPDDDTFVRQLNQLIAERGIEVCASIFLNLASLDLPLETARNYWIGVQEHRRELRKQLGRDVDLITAMSDFLRSATGLFAHTRIVEIGSYERIIHETIHDSLTGLFNRMYFSGTYEQQISLARRYGTDLSVLFLDLDNFKEINDNHGHIVGDLALKKVAEIIKKEKRDSDTAARYGGEEFVLLMPHTDSINSFVLAERIRKEIEKTPIVNNQLAIHLTISGGLATFPLNSQNPQDLLRMADDAVYLAKGAGKNTISLYKHEKRRYLRVKLNQPVLVQELGFSPAEIFSGYSKDIGIGGILFENPVKLPIGARIKVNVPMGTGAPVLLIGTVVRVEVFGPDSYDIGMTISFKEMEKVACSRITSLLRYAEQEEDQHRGEPVS